MLCLFDLGNALHQNAKLSRGRAHDFPQSKAPDIKAFTLQTEFDKIVLYLGFTSVVEFNDGIKISTEVRLKYIVTGKRAACAP